MSALDGNRNGIEHRAYINLNETTFCMFNKMHTANKMNEKLSYFGVQTVVILWPCVKCVEEFI